MAFLILIDRFTFENLRTAWKWSNVPTQVSGKKAVLLSDLHCWRCHPLQQKWCLLLYVLARLGDNHDLTAKFRRRECICWQVRLAEPDHQMIFGPEPLLHRRHFKQSQERTKWFYRLLYSLLLSRLLHVSRALITALLFGVLDVVLSLCYTLPWSPNKQLEHLITCCNPPAAYMTFMGEPLLLRRPLDQFRKKVEAPESRRRAIFQPSWCWTQFANCSWSHLCFEGENTPFGGLHHTSVSTQRTCISVTLAFCG